MQLSLKWLFLMSFLLTGCASKYRGPREEVAMSYALEDYGKAVAEQQKMELLIVGDSTSSKETDFCITLRSVKKVSLKDGRVMAVNHVNSFVNMLRADGKVKDYLRFCHNEHSYYPSEVLIANVGYKIVFWDENINRPKKPYLAEILFQDSTFYYFVADDKTQELQLVFEEPYAL